MKKVLITGANGFVGKYLEKELSDYGYDVIGLDILGSVDYAVDITDEDAVRQAIKKIQPHFIFHLAGFSSPYEAEKNSELARSINVGGTRSILEAALLLQDKPKILVVSSAYVYGIPQYIPIDEKHSLAGVGVYAESRKEQEKLIETYNDKLSIIVTRSFNHTGAGQKENFVIPKIMKQIVEIDKGSKKDLSMGNINISRDITDVRDVVRAYRLLLEQKKDGIICNVCRGESISLKEVIGYGKVFSGLKKIDIHTDLDFIHKNEILDIYGDNSYVKDLIDWEPKFSYKDMLNDIYTYWKSKINI